MIVEAVESLFTRCPPAWRRLGYAYAAVACSARGRRRAAAWAPHRERTRAAILAAAEACPRRRTALLLGAGPLDDVPLEALAAAFDRVVLADIALLPAARLAKRRFPNVQLALVDLTGTADALEAARGEAPPKPGCGAFLDDATVDLVVSCNLASQLPLIPVARAERRWPGIDADAYGREVVAAHLAHLRGFRQAVVLLVADVVRAVFARDAALESQEDPLYGLDLPPGPEWEWDLAPPGELRSGRSVMTRVRAVRLDAQDTGSRSGN